MAYQNGQTVTDVKKNVSRPPGEIRNKSSDVVEVKTPSSLTEKILSSNTEEVFSMMETAIKDIRSKLATARDSSTDFVKKYPLYSVLGAAAIGATAGVTAAMMWRSRSSTTK